MVQRLTWRMARRVAFGVTGAILIGSIGFQASRVDGFSMAPTLEDRDRLLVNKAAYAFSDPQPGDIVTFYYPPDPARIFVKRVIAVEGQTVQIVGGRVLVNDCPLHDDYVPPAFRDHDDHVTIGQRLGHPLRVRHGRSPERQLGQPRMGLRTEEVHRRQGERAMVAVAGCDAVLILRARCRVGALAADPRVRPGAYTLVGPYRDQSCNAFL